MALEIRQDTEHADHALRLVWAGLSVTIRQGKQQLSLQRRHRRRTPTEAGAAGWRMEDGAWSLGHGAGSRKRGAMSMSTTGGLVN